jgi:hypothetical protein
MARMAKEPKLYIVILGVFLLLLPCYFHELVANRGLSLISGPSSDDSSGLVSGPDEFLCFLLPNSTRNIRDKVHVG